MQRRTACLDDRRRFWECLTAAGCTCITPHTWVDIDAFLHQLGAQAEGGATSTAGGDQKALAAAGNGVVGAQGSAATPSATATSSSQPVQQLWFLKHGA